MANCKFCESEFELKPNADQNRVTCYQCGEFFKTQKGKVWLNKYRQTRSRERRLQSKTHPNALTTYALRKHHTSRQAGYCGHCSSVATKMHLDHILRVADGGKDTIDNTWLICAECHKIKTSSEYYRARLKGYMSCTSLNECQLCAKGVLESHSALDFASIKWLNRGESRLPVFHFTRSESRRLIGCSNAAIKAVHEYSSHAVKG